MAAISKTSSSPEYLFCTRASSHRTGTVEYAMARGTVLNDTIHLLFKISTEPFDEILPYISDFSPIEIDQESPEHAFQIHCITHKSDDLNKVSKVFVDVMLTNPLSSINLALTGISVLCSRNFPNMNPQNSSLQAHYGENHWRCDALLLPLQTSPDQKNSVCSTRKVYVMQ